MLLLPDSEPGQQLKTQSAYAARNCYAVLVFIYYGFYCTSHFQTTVANVKLPKTVLITANIFVVYATTCVTDIFVIFVIRII